MNNINKLQNDKIALEAQASARYYYNQADKYDLSALFFSVALVFLNIWLINNKTVITLQMVWFFINIFIERIINDYVDKGATLKESFDYYIYGWKTNFSVHDKDLIKEVSLKNSDFLKTQIENDGAGTIGGVKDWHTAIDSSWAQNVAIKKAMKTNVEINGILMKGSKAFLSLLFILMIVYVLLASKNLTAFELLVHIFITFSVLSSKIIETTDNIKRIDDLNLIVNTMLDIEGVNNLKEIQSKIDDKRKIHFPIDFILYKRLRKKIHNMLSSL